MSVTEYFRLWSLLRLLYDVGGVDPYWVVSVMVALIRTKTGPYTLAEHRLGHNARLYMLLAVRGPTYLVQEWVEYFPSERERLARPRPGSIWRVS